MYPCRVPVPFHMTNDLHTNLRAVQFVFRMRTHTFRLFGRLRYAQLHESEARPQLPYMYTIFIL